MNSNISLIDPYSVFRPGTHQITEEKKERKSKQGGKKKRERERNEVKKYISKVIERKQDWQDSTQVVHTLASYFSNPPTQTLAWFSVTFFYAPKVENDLSPIGILRYPEPLASSPLPQGEGRTKKELKYKKEEKDNFLFRSIKRQAGRGIVFPWHISSFCCSDLTSASSGCVD